MLQAEKRFGNWFCKIFVDEIFLSSISQACQYRASQSFFKKTIHVWSKFNSTSGHALLRVFDFPQS